MAVKWLGKAVQAQVLAAEFKAVNETTEAAAQAATDSHWWRNRSGRLEEQTISEPAKLDGAGVVGKFGTTRGKGFYGLFLELREPFLQPAADETFPTLGERIREKLAE